MSSDDSAVPALFDHCCRAYKAMLAESKAVIGQYAGDSKDEQQHVVVYEGFLTQLITGELNLSVPYYTSVRKALIQMGCIRQLRRGGGTSPSQWEMIHEPTVEAFMHQQPAKKAKAPDRYTAMQDQIVQLTSRIADLEDTLEELVAAWAREFGAKEVKE
jgi:hypothetical protein